MTRKEKNQTISDLKEKFSQYDNFYITNYMGMDVEEINQLRMACHGEGIEYMVAKNTLVKKALEEREGVPEEVLASLEGPTSIFFSDIANAPAKVIKNFLEKSKLDKDSYKKIILKGGHIEESMYLGHEQLDVLVALKSKEELIGDVIMLLQSPMKNLLSSLGSAKQNISSLLTALENNPNVELKNKKDNVQSESSSEEPAAEQSSSEEPAAEQSSSEEPLEDASID
mgnify:CR=1 FL=1